MSRNEEICSTFFDIQKWIPEFEIDKEKRNALCFREALTVELKDDITKTTKPVGGYCILVDSLGPDSREFVIHVQSSMTIDGHFGGSKIIGSSTEKFHCLEEKRTEFVYKECGLYKKSLYLGRTEDAYYMKLTHACPCNKVSESKDLNFCYTNGFLSEGVSLILMRYLAIVNYEGSLAFESLNIDGDVVKSKYICFPAENREIDRETLMVYTVERRIYEKDGTIYHIRTYLSPLGRIIQHNWLNEHYMLKINPFAQSTDTGAQQRICVPLRDRWPQDIEMMSKYLDIKSQKMTDQAEYLEDHPEIKHLIADYVQTLLVVKPEDVIEFTIQHFKAFADDPKAWETSALDKMYDELLKQELWNRRPSTCDVCKIPAVCKSSEDNEDAAGVCLNIVTTDTLCPKCHVQSGTGKREKDFMTLNLNKCLYSESENNLDSESCRLNLSTSRWPDENLYDEGKINVISILNQDNGDAPVEMRRCSNCTISFTYEPRGLYLYHFLPGDVSL